MTISFAFSTKLNKIKKALEFSLLRIVEGGDKISIISVFISFKFSLSKLLSEFHFLPSKIAIY